MKRFTHYLVTTKAGASEPRLFTQIQADSIRAVLEPDGLAPSWAAKLVAKWNREARVFGAPLRYGLPERAE